MNNKREDVGINHFNDPKAFIEYSNDMRHVYKNINYYNPYKENKILIVFDDMIADMINNKKLNSIVTELFIRGRKLNIFLAFIAQSYFRCYTKYYSIFYNKNLKQKRTSTNCKKSFHQILALKISLISTGNVLLNHICFLLMILPLHQIIL